jgi:hypothetical protein
MRTFILSLVAGSLLATSALAQSTCAPETLHRAIDAYAMEPFGARAWRKMTGLGDPEIEPVSFDSESYATSEEWRKLVSDVLPASEALKSPSYNCRLSYPLEVLKQRVARFGKTSDYVKQWAAGQESVVRACGSGADVPVETTMLPANLKPDEIALLKHDQDYQKASVKFYVKHTEAIAAFRAIATSDSPHRSAARYNIASMLANAKNVTGARDEAKAILADPSLASVHAITRDLVGYMASLEDTPDSWSQLIDGRVETLSQPMKDIVGNPAAEVGLARALYDFEYAGIKAKQDDWWITGTLPENPTLSKALARSAIVHPMVMWMMAGQSVNKPATEAPWALMGAKWQSWAASYVDRAQALQPQALPLVPKVALESLKAGTDDTSRATLWNDAISAADKATTSCGEASETGAVTLLALQAIRVSAMAGRYDEIYANLPKLKLNDTLSMRLTLLPKLMEHVLATGNVEEGRRLRDAFIKDGLLSSFNKDDEWQRGPYADFLGWIAEDETIWWKAQSLKPDKLWSDVLNLLPAAKLRALSEDPMFSPAQKARLKRAAWTRNYARGIGNGDKITSDMLAANPEIAAAYEATSKQFPKLKAERLWALTILRNPRFGILVKLPEGNEARETEAGAFAALDEYNPNDNNWWCPLQTDRHLGALRRDYDAAAGLQYVRVYPSRALTPLLETELLTKFDAARDKALKQHPMVKQISWKEVAALAQAPSGSKLLAQTAIRWGKASKGDDGAPEALALAVRASRYGCRWAGSVESFSRPAQELLKAKFPTTTWAAQTPYWFACLRQTYDAEYRKVMTCKPETWPKQTLLR